MKFRIDFRDKQTGDVQSLGTSLTHDEIVKVEAARATSTTNGNALAVVFAVRNAHRMTPDGSAFIGDPLLMN